MALNIGNNAVANAFVGSSQVRRAYKGGTLVYQGFGPASELEFIQQTATGGPAKLLKVYGKTIVDAGSLQSNKTSLLRAERVPVINVWDEEWENGFITNTGVKAPDPTSIRSINYIAINGGQNYYCKIPRGAVRICWYTSEKIFISKSNVLANTYITAPNEARYILFYANTQYGTTYNHDICINLSDPAINGQYFPHWRGSLALNLSTLTGKLNGEGASVAVFPDGMRGVGTDRDAAYGSTGEVRIGQVDLGTLTWYHATSAPLGAHFYASLSPASKDDNRGVLPFCAKYQGVTAVSRYFSQDDKVISIEDGTRVRIWDSAYTSAADFKAAMSGVMLDYPLATPLTYTLDTPLPTDLTCEQGDILQRVSDNNCPFVGEMKFGL